jgi:hypothetical protein
MPRTPLRAEDRQYYFRVRQKPAWGLRTQVLAVPATNTTVTVRGGEVAAFATEAKPVGWPKQFDRFRLAAQASYRGVKEALAPA